MTDEDREEIQAGNLVRRRRRSGHVSMGKARTLYWKTGTGLARDLRAFG
jgi:hypothetical protein